MSVVESVEGDPLDRAGSRRASGASMEVDWVSPDPVCINVCNAPDVLSAV